LETLTNFDTEAGLAREILRANRSAALATLGEDGAPFGSYVTIAPAETGTPLLLLSKLAVHTRNLERDPRASLLLVREAEPGSEALTAVRLTLTGRLHADENPEAKRLFLAAHPDAARYAGFADFAVYRFSIEAGHLVAGFGRIVRLSAHDLLGGPAAA